MKKTLVPSVPLVTIFLLIEMGCAKPLDNSEIANHHDVTAKSVAGFPEHIPNSTESNYADFTDTYSPDKKIGEGPISDESDRLTTKLSVSNGIKNGFTPLKPDSVETSILPVPLKPGHEKLDSLLTTLKPGSWTASSSITTLEPVSGGNAGSLVTSSESGSGKPDSLVTTLEPGIVSTTVYIGSEEPGSLSTTLKSDSGRRGSSAASLKPGARDPSDPLHTLSVKNGHRSEASFIRSSFMMVLLGVFLISGSHIT